MIQLKRIIAPVDDTPFDEICSFETANYIGIFVDDFPKYHISGFILMPKDDIEFWIIFIETPNNLEKLDTIVCGKVDEHIESVSTSRRLEVKIIEDE